MMSTKGKKESRIKKCIKAPIRILIKARDCYVRSVSDCSGRVGYGSATGIGSCPAFTQMSSLPRSFSVNSSDFRELMRISSKRNHVELEILRQKSLAKKGMNVVPRTRYVAIGRIDEEEACDFGEELVKLNTDVCPTSRSYAVSSTRARMLISPKKI